MQRFKFIQDERASNEVRSSRSPTPGIKSGKDVVLTLPPSNGTSNLVGALVQTIKPTTNLSWNIAWTYGPLFLDVPQRLGISEALDAAVWTLVSGHSDLRSQSPQVSERTLELHGIALKALRKCLHNPAKAHTTETLCAVYLLLVCQVRYMSLGIFLAYYSGVRGKWQSSAADSYRRSCSASEILGQGRSTRCASKKALGNASRTSNLRRSVQPKDRDESQRMV